jgi:hypothetical protein
VQLLITLAVIGVVSTIAVMGITRARASMRLSNSTRQFAAYVERTRADAVRRHGQASVEMLTNSTYRVTMDFNAGGVVTSQTFSLEKNVTFITELKTITFDWRGRLAAEISVGFGNEAGTANVNITGSGDVTIDSESFHDASVPHVTYSANVSGDVIPDPAATPGDASSTTPTPSDSPTNTATPTASPSATATPKGGQGHQQSPTPTPTPGTSPSPTSSSSPGSSTTPTPTPCSMTALPSPLTVVQNGSGVVSAALVNFSGSATITATSGNSGQIQVSPASRNVTGSSSATFTITVKRQSGSVTFDSVCGSKTVSVNVQ